MSLNTCWKNEARLAKIFLGGYNRVHPTHFSFLPIPFLCLAWLHAQSRLVCQILCSPMDCSLPGSSVHGTFQVRILEWVAMPSSRGSSQPSDWTHVSGIAGGFFIHWATWEGLTMSLTPNKCPTLQILPQSWLLNNPAYSKYLLIPSYSNVSITLSVLKIHCYSYYEIIAKMNSEFPQQLF